METKLKPATTDINNPLLYHHCRPTLYSPFSKVVQTQKTTDEHDAHYHNAYLWIQQRVGFYPLFLAVGITLEDLKMTGYQNQWRKLLSYGPNGKIYRQKDESPNDALFSFYQKPKDGIYMDYIQWHLVLNSAHNNYQTPNHYERSIFKPHLSDSKWLEKAKKHPHSVQLVVPSLDLTEANCVWVRNKDTKILFEKLGFTNVVVKRLKLEQ